MYAGLFVLDEDAFESVYGDDCLKHVGQRVNLLAKPLTRQELASHPDLLREAEIILSGWGAPQMDATFISSAPKLRAVFYGAGSIRRFVSEAVWERGIVISSAHAANAIPVVEYTLAAILFSLKHGWRFVHSAREHRGYQRRENIPGAYNTTVGLVSLGTIGKLLRERLRSFDLKVIAYDPLWTQEAANAMNVTLVSLDEVFSQADVVSIHTPLLPETKQFIRAEHFARMKPGATFINTARGGLVREAEMINVLRERPDLYAVLDVTDPEPPHDGSPLYDMVNVLITPHIAGAMSGERRRLGWCMVEELDRYLSGQPLAWSIDRVSAMTMA